MMAGGAEGRTGFEGIVGSARRVGEVEAIACSAWREGRSDEAVVGRASLGERGVCRAGEDLVERGFDFD